VGVKLCELEGKSWDIHQQPLLCPWQRIEFLLGSQLLRLGMFEMIGKEKEYCDDWSGATAFYGHYLTEILNASFSWRR
jgi:hypothetical protein